MITVFVCNLHAARRKCKKKFRLEGDSEPIVTSAIQVLLIN